MKYYHGSIVPNLETLYPFNTSNSLSDKECIYLTSRKEIALLYIWVRKFMWLTYGFDKQGNVVYTETHKGALEEFYKNVKGYIYSVEINDEHDNDTHIKNTITVYSETPVFGCEVIEDVYAEIIKYEDQGIIRIRRYQDLSKEDKEKNRSMILKELSESALYRNDRVLLRYIMMRFPDIYIEFKALEMKTGNCSVL
ncbi:MAG: hypothetical protein JXN65_12370 [Clostridia bacterium]|nr:hypothetical protein [Clostridia bacterium]